LDEATPRARESSECIATSEDSKLAQEDHAHFAILDGKWQPDRCQPTPTTLQRRFRSDDKYAGRNGMNRQSAFTERTEFVQVERSAV
jgi:hypothetical protein